MPCRRHGLVRRTARHGDRPAKRPRHQAESLPQLRACPSPKAIARPCARWNSRPNLAAPSFPCSIPWAPIPALDAEERGQAEAIAYNLREMSRLGVPVIVVVIGEGGSGGALGVAVGNRIYMLQNAWYSVISPESCAAIIYRDSARAPEAAAALKITAPDLLKLRPDRRHHSRTRRRRAHRSRQCRGSLARHSAAHARPNFPR